jgi:hypothetical protein
MTRKSIEACAKGFIVLLTVIFLYGVWQVLAMIGLL